MKRRDFNRVALGIALSPILANVAAQTEAFAQPASENTVANDPIAAVRKYVDAFNRGDAAVMATTFAVPGSILDGMAPHVWQGPTATQDWYRDVLVEGKQHGASDYFITLDEPLHNNVTGDSAYVVVPATMTFKGARRAGYANGRSIYSGASQDRRRVADRGLGLGERHPSITSMPWGRPGAFGQTRPLLLRCMSSLLAPS